MMYVFNINIIGEIAMKILKKFVCVLLSILICSNFSVIIPSTAATISPETMLGASSLNEAICYKDNDSYVKVADFENSDYVELMNDNNIYYSVSIDSELIYDASLTVEVKSLDTGATETFFYGHESVNYDNVSPNQYYIPIDLLKFSGKVDLWVFLTLSNGQKLNSDTVVKLNLLTTDTIVATGKCGVDLYWSLFDSGLLEISGIGKMNDYSIFAESTDDTYIPWKKYRQQIKSVVIRDGVTSIGDYAFYGKKTADSLLSVNIPDSVKTIGHASFMRCVSLKSISLPDSITEIGVGVFSECKSLQSVRLSNSLTDISESAFAGCELLKSIDFPSNVRTIGPYAFSGAGFETITIPKTIVELERQPFYGLSLKEIVFEGDIIVDDGIASQSPNLQKAKFSGSITFSGKTNEECGDMFKGCSSLEFLTIPSVFYFNGNTYPIQSYDNFSGCDKLDIKNILFNDNPKVIDDVVFSSDGKTLLWYHKNLKNNNYVIPYGVETLAWQSFEGNENIEHIVIPDTVKMLNGRVFANCTKLNNVIIPEGVDELFDFQNCTSLKSIVIPDSVTKMYQSYKDSVETFSNVSGITVYCNSNSYAEDFFSESSSLGTTTDIVYCSFDANGGNVSNTKQAVIPQDKYWILPTATRQGYSFEGWYTEKNNGTKITTDSTVLSESSFTLYAHWSPNYKAISNCNIIINPTSLYYDGTAKKPTVIVKDGSVTLAENTDYTVSYSSNTKVGTATVTITGIGSYDGVVNKIFNILYESISLDSNKTVEINTAGSKRYFIFSPSSNMTVRFYSQGSVDTYGYLYDADLNQLSSNDDGGENRNFELTYDLTAGKTYIFSCRLYSSSNTGSFEVRLEQKNNDTEKPTVSISSTNSVASSQTVTLNLSDNVGIQGYYWGTSSQYADNTYTTTTNKSILKTVNLSGTYYATVIDTSGNVSTTQSITFYKTTLNANGGTVSPTSVLTKSGNSFTFPTPTRSNYSCKGWSTSSTASSGVNSLSPSSNSTYYAVWKKSYEFVWGQDNWSFNNSSSYFENYDVNSTVFNLMKQDFGLSNSQAYELKQAIEEGNYYGFGGSCFGMTVSEIMAKQGDISLSRYGGNDNINKNSNTSNMTSVINFIQNLQSVSRCSQVLRQVPFMSGGYSQYDFIDKAESVLTNEAIFVKIAYGIKYLNKNTGEYSSAGYHAVLGYGIEDCNYYSPVTGKSYDKKILVADPNYLSQNQLYDDSCIYYRSSDHSWICPYWNTSGSSYAYLCYWNSSSGTSTNTGFIKNIMKYTSLVDTVDLMADYSVSHYIAGLKVENISGNLTAVDQIENTGNPNLEYAGPAGSGIAQYNIEMDDSYNVKEGEEFYALWNPTANYSVSYTKPSTYNLKMDYEDIVYYANVDNGVYTLLKPNGSINLRGSDATYSLTMVTDDTECVTDWYALSVTGKNVDNLTFSKQNNGYVLTSNCLNNVEISAKNNNVEVNKTFSTTYDSVFIYEIDENTIGLKVDTDGNGTYETELEDKQDVYEIGDTDLDGRITVRDVTAIQRHLVNAYPFNKEQLVLADTNEDGKVDITDATHLQSYLVGYDVMIG